MPTGAGTSCQSLERLRVIQVITTLVGVTVLTSRSVAINSLFRSVWKSGIGGISVAIDVAMR